MPPRKKQAPQAPSTMKELKDTLWKAADKLRGSLSASQYKDVILGLVFLKYVSDAYDERREAIRAELAAEGMEESQIEDLIDDPEQYQGYGVFVVPVSARWKFLAENTKGKPAVGGEPAKNIGQLIDEAMDAVMKANPTLGGTLPRLYNKDNIDQRRLGELIDLFNSARFSRQGEHRARDLMGEVYEYFLGNFARAEGKRGGEFFTPPSVVKVIVEVLEPSSGRVYDPCCGSGGMFVQTEKFIYEHDGDPKDVSIYGQESIEETWRMAKMNLAIHGIDNKGLGARWSDTFARDQHPDVQMDYVMANPPFNIKDWARNEDEPPRHVRRLQFLERMGSCQVVHRGGTRRSCVSGRCGWSQRSAVSTIRSGQRSVRSPVYLVLAARRRCVSGCARRRSMPAHGPGPRPKNPLS